MLKGCDFAEVTVLQQTFVVKVKVVKSEVLQQKFLHLS